MVCYDIAGMSGNHAQWYASYKTEKGRLVGIKAYWRVMAGLWKAIGSGFFLPKKKKRKWKMNCTKKKKLKDPKKKKLKRAKEHGKAL